MQLLNIPVNAATKDHPQTDRKSKNMIRTLSSMLRTSIKKYPNIRDTRLSELELIYNFSKNASTGLSPFEVDIGYIPYTPFTRSLSDCSTKCQAAFGSM